MISLSQDLQLSSICFGLFSVKVTQEHMATSKIRLLNILFGDIHYFLLCGVCPVQGTPGMLYCQEIARTL
jgi:hypothetical protein